MLSKLIKKLDLDSAGTYFLATRIVLLVSGPIVTLLIASFFSLAQQGYFFTIRSLVEIQIFFELGLNAVIIQFIGYESSKIKVLENKTLSGSKESMDAFQSITSFSFKWFFVAALLYGTSLAVFGTSFLGRSEELEVSQWMLPWALLIGISTLNILALPLWSILEGLQLRKEAFSYRFLSTLVNSTGICIGIGGGYGLWALVIGSGSALCLSLLYLFKFRNIFIPHVWSVAFKKLPVPSGFLAMQARMGVSFISGYFTFSSFTMIAFYTHGAVAAGKIGLTVTVAKILGQIPSAWIAPKAAIFSNLMSQYKFKELDKILFKIIRHISAIYAFILVGILCGFFVVSQYFESFLERIVPFEYFMFFIAAYTVVVYSTPFGYYLRAQKKELLAVPSLVSGFAVVLFSYLIAVFYNPEAIGFSFFIVNVLIFPWIISIWKNERSKLTLSKGIIS